MPPHTGRNLVSQLIRPPQKHIDQPTQTAGAARPVSTTGNVTPPAVPRSLVDTGLTLAHLADLSLKLLYLHGSLTGGEICRQLRLPFSVVEEALTFLRQVKCLEVRSGEMLGQLTYRFLLTEEGRARAREAFEQSRYVGPAPVSLRQYVEQCRRQRVSGIECTSERLTPAFDGMLVRPGLLDELGPAICDGQAIFLHGPPGNGKTLMARRIGRYLNTYGGEIYVPYAVLIDSAIVTVFDPNVHQTTDDAECGDALLPASFDHDAGGSLVKPAANGAVDQRWRRIRRPVVITAGELTLEMLDLRFNADSRYYSAPSHLKANGGVFVIDDFGRQQVTPRELLNRWILPLAERIDYLALATGKKFAVPFDQLVIFSTNLDPAELVDDAFLRRIRHKLSVSPPSREQFSELFRRSCDARGIVSDGECIGHLFSNHYSLARPPRWSDPQDLLEIAACICRFRGTEVRLSRELISEAARRFFGTA
ncbi:MAG: ATPase [Planctomycetaceae bacterium]